MQQTLVGGDAKAQTPEGRITPLTITPPKETYQEAVRMLKEAKRPVIIVGHGSRFNMESIIRFAEKLSCPVLTTYKAKGLISDAHPLGCGVLGRSGTPIASYFMNEADLLLVVGASFSNHSGISPKIPTIQIDFDPLALSKFHKIQAAVWGEISVTMDMLHDEDIDLSNKVDQREEIAKRWGIWKEEKQTRLQEDNGEGVSSSVVFNALTKHAPSNAVMTVDVGNNAYSFGRYFQTVDHSIIMSGYLGSIGFAMPAALGAWAAVGEDRPIIAVAGDGGFAQYMGEFTTAVRYKMPIKVVILNNYELAKISKEQRALEVDVWQTKLVNPHFAQYAESCGGLGIRVEDKEEVYPAMERLMAHEGPALLEILCDPKLI